MLYLLTKPRSTAPVRICYDSSYAFHMAQGLWKPLRHHALISRIQQLVRTVNRHRKIHWQHIFGHTGNFGNEKADQNAKRGAQGQYKIWTRFRQTRTNWDPVPPPDTHTTAAADPPDNCKVPWDDFAAILRDSARLVCGTTKRHKLPSFYTQTDMQHIQHLIEQQAICGRRVHLARGKPTEATLRQEWQAAKTRTRVFKQSCRNKWAENIIAELNDAMSIHDLGRFFQLLPKLGVHVHGKSQEGREYFTLDAARAHFQSTMADPVPVEPDLITHLPEIPTVPTLGDLPNNQEIAEALSSLVNHLLATTRSPL